MPIQALTFAPTNWPPNSNPEKLYEIGRGRCGITLSKSTAAYLIAKWEINPPTHASVFGRGPLTLRRWPNAFHDTSIGLANDWRMHKTVFESFRYNSAFTQNIEIPQPFSYVDQNDTLWNEQSGLVHKMPPQHSELRDMLISQCIPPVPVTVHEHLINISCPEQSKGLSWIGLEDQICLIRPYLGKRHPVRTEQSQDKMIDLELHVSFIAETMADALAVMRWKAQVDARDVEFVLGGVPGDDKTFLLASDERWLAGKLSRTNQGQWSHTSSTSSVIDFNGERVCMWLLDFNQCQKMTMDDDGVEKAVEAYFLNDPYYPRPPQGFRNPQRGALPDENGPAGQLSMYEDEENWSTFRDSYLATSAELLKDSPGCQHLPQVFIGRVMEEQKVRFAKSDVHSGKPDVDNGESYRQDDDWVVLSSEDFHGKMEDTAKASILGRLLPPKLWQITKESTYPGIGIACISS